MKLYSRLCRSFLFLAVAAGCGPELTDASQVDITGHWTTNTAIGPLSGFNTTITQAPDGTMSGQWSAKFFPLDAPCPPGLGSDPVGPVSGTNSVFEVRLEFLGAGVFDGQIIDSKTIRGSFESCDKVYDIEFSLH